MDDGEARGSGGGVRSGVSAQVGGGGGRGGLSCGGGVARGWGFRVFDLALVLLSGRLRVLLDSATDAAVAVGTLVVSGRSEVVALAVTEEPPTAESKKHKA